MGITQNTISFRNKLILAPRLNRFFPRRRVDLVTTPASHLSEGGSGGSNGLSTLLAVDKVEQIADRSAKPDRYRSGHVSGPYVEMRPNPVPERPLNFEEVERLSSRLIKSRIVRAHLSVECRPELADFVLFPSFSLYA